MNIGFGNYIPYWRVALILTAQTTCVGKNVREKAKEDGRIYKATCGRKTRSMVITDTNQVILSPVFPETLIQRLKVARAAGEKEQKENPDNGG